MVSTERRLEYASGFLELGMLNEASDELEKIEGDAQLSAELMTKDQIAEATKLAREYFEKYGKKK